MAVECEAKIKVDDMAVLQLRLRQIGAADEGECLERNWVLDDKDGSLQKNDVLLRVRNLGDVGGILTVKRKIAGVAFKTREEVESMTDSTADLLHQLELVGFRTRWIYEKRRQTWLHRDCVITLDTLPEIGCYIEIEGAAEIIRDVALELGLNPENHIDDTYLGLWNKHLAAQGEPQRHMVFAQPDKETTT